MPNHPNRSPVEKALRRLIAKHQLDKVEVVVTSDSCYARAFPASWSDAVRARLGEAFATREGSMTLAEATAIREKCYGDPIAVASSIDLIGAVTRLTECLVSSGL